MLTSCKPARLMPVMLAQMMRRMLWVVLWLGIAGSSLAASTGEELEYAVKGAFLIKFASFVDWPPAAFPTADTPFIIGILGTDPFGPKLEQLSAGQNVYGRPIAIRRFTRIDQVNLAHILFISQADKARMPVGLSGLSEQNILTVADVDQPGVAINFVIEDNRVRFAIDLEPIGRSGLKVSSKLLGVAKQVRGALKP